MFSPQDRIYNTPDISVPAAEAILQQIRLERVLRRFGYFACGKPTTIPSHCVEPPLVCLGPPAPTRGIRPFGAHEVFTGWQKSRNVQISPPHKFDRPKKSEKSPRSYIPGAPIDDPFLQKQRDTVGGCKYGGVHLSSYGLKPDVKRAHIFKPFQPQKSPLRLPAIQRERNHESEVREELHLTDINKHVRLHKRHENEVQKSKQSELRNKRKRLMEMEFMKWEEDHDSYFDRSMDSFYEAVREIPERKKSTDEQSYRDRISEGIKQGVKERMKSFGQSSYFASGHVIKTRNIPVKDMKFGSVENEKTRKSPKRRKNKNK